MSDYVITSASLTAIFNATVTVSPHDGGGIDCPGDPGDTPLQFGVGDSATFYVLISYSKYILEQVANYLLNNLVYYLNYKFLIKKPIIIQL